MPAAPAHLENKPLPRVDAAALSTLAVALGGAALAAYATPWGLWGYSDSAAYIAAARNLAGGLGLTLPDAAGALHLSTLTPPFYTILLAPGAVPGLDPLDWARALNLLLAFLFPAGLGLLGARASGARWAGPLLALLAAAFPVLFTNAVSAMSEALFFCLGFGGLLLLAVPPERLSPRRLALSAALVGLSALTRYLGAAFIAAAVALVWLGAPRRWARAAVYALGAALPLALWLGCTMLATGAFGARSLDAPPAALGGRWNEFFTQSLAILSTGLPFAGRGGALFPGPARLALLFFLWAAAAGWGWSAAPAALRRLLLAAALFNLFYLLALAAAFLFASIPPDLIPRIYSPLWPAVWLGLLAAAQAAILRLERARASGAGRGWAQALRTGLALVCAAQVLYFAPRLVELTALGHAEGVGYTSRTWRDAPVFERIQSELGERPLISDEPALILLYTGRGAYPWEEWVRGNLRAAAHGSAPGQGQGRLDELMRSGAALVLFPPRVEEEYGPESRDLLQRWTGGMYALYSAPEAEILLAP